MRLQSHLMALSRLPCKPLAGPNARLRPDRLGPCGLGRRAGGAGGQAEAVSMRAGWPRAFKKHIDPARRMNVVMVSTRGWISVLSLDHINTISSFKGVSATPDIQP